MKLSKTYGVGSQLKVNPETLFNFVSSPFEASKLPSPNLNLTSPTETEEVFLEQKIEEERLSPTRASHY